MTLDDYEVAHRVAVEEGGKRDAVRQLARSIGLCAGLMASGEICSREKDHRGRCAAPGLERRAAS